MIVSRRRQLPAVLMMALVLHHLALRNIPHRHLIHPGRRLHHCIMMVGNPSRPKFTKTMEVAQSIQIPVLVHRGIVNHLLHAPHAYNLTGLRLRLRHGHPLGPEHVLRLHSLSQTSKFIILRGSQ